MCRWQLARRIVSRWFTHIANIAYILRAAAPACVPILYEFIRSTFMLTLNTCAPCGAESVLVTSAVGVEVSSHICTEFACSSLTCKVYRFASSVTVGTYVTSQTALDLIALVIFQLWFIYREQAWRLVLITNLTPFQSITSVAKLSPRGKLTCISIPHLTFLARVTLFAS